jgi:hypothetical protein
MANATISTITATGDVVRTVLIQYPVGANSWLYTPVQMAEISRILNREFNNMLATLAAEMPELIISG